MVIDPEVGAAHVGANLADTLDAEAGQRGLRSGLVLVITEPREPGGHEGAAARDPRIQPPGHLVAQRLETRDHHGPVPPECAVIDRIEQQGVEQEVVLGEDPEPSSMLLDIRVWTGQERDLRARREIAIYVLVGGVVPEDLPHRFEARPVGMVVEATDDVVVQPPSVREALDEP